MASLSYFDDELNGFVLAANAIFPISPVEVGKTFAFEVIEDDASGLRNLFNKDVRYHVEGTVFTGRLKSASKRQSTHQGLRLLRDKPTLRADIDVLSLQSPGSDSTR